jgi:hypothetical protein
MPGIAHQDTSSTVIADLKRPRQAKAMSCKLHWRLQGLALQVLTKITVRAQITGEGSRWLFSNTSEPDSLKVRIALRCFATSSRSATLPQEVGRGVGGVNVPFKFHTGASTR